MRKSVAIADEMIISNIYFLRGQKAMLDKDLAKLYDVTTGNLNKAVKRNLKRFPRDFMFSNLMSMIFFTNFSSFRLRKYSR